MPVPMAEQTITTMQWVSTLPMAIIDNLGGLFAPFSRFYLPYILLTVILGLGAFYFNRRHIDPDGKKGAFGYLFDPAVHFQPSTLVDLKIVLANRLFTPVLVLIGRGATVISATAVASIILGEQAFQNAEPLANASLILLTAITISVTLASDFTTYWVHRICHENPVFWPFHKLHHSAETLTPITFARKHPLYDLIRVLSNAFIVGPTQGLIFAVFGVGDIVTILGVNAVYAVFHWTGSNLRHTHVWLSYGPFLNRIFISPCLHQIHHSCAAEHHDKNYGEIFAFWDWMFGTLYVPAGYEKLQFGLGDEKGRRLAQAHPTLKDAYLVPIRECAAALTTRRGEQHEAEPASPVA